MSSTTTVTERPGEQPDQKLILQAYGGAIEDVKPLPSFPADTPIEVLQQHFKEHGVLWIKNILSPTTVNTCRRQYLEFLNNGTNLLAPNTNPEHGIFSSLDWKQFIHPGATRLVLGLEDKGPFVDNVVNAHVAPFYLQFKNEVGTQLEPFVGGLLGFKEPWCLPRSLLRCSVPGAESTPVHYDQIFLRGGPPTSVTAWVPIGDIGEKEGGLLYLEKSHEIGAKYEADFSKLNADLSDEEKVSHVNRNMNAGGFLDRNSSKFGRNWGRSWLVGDYEAGDVVFHNPYMIHAGAINESPKNRIRASTDLRFVDKSQPFDQRWTFAAYSDEDPALARKIKKKDDA